MKKYDVVASKLRLMMQIFSLFYIRNDAAVKSVNGMIGLEGYIDCINNLSRSLNLYDLRLTILTNNKQLLEKTLVNEIKIEEIPFYLKPPLDITFYSAHFKLDCFRYISEKSIEYSLLIDNDILCNRELPLPLIKAAQENIPLYYDVTDQIYPGVGFDRIISDKTEIMGKQSVGLWAGGEFIAGGKEFFKAMYDKSMSFWDSYLDQYKKWHHQSDEMVASCAIEALMHEGWNILNAGSFGIVDRLWNVDTMHVEKKIEAYHNVFLVHLPAKKRFIAQASIDSNFDLFSELAQYNLCEMRADEQNKKKSIFIRFLRKVRKFIR